MIYQALSILWGGFSPSLEDQNKIFSNPGDDEIYARIYEIARSHEKIVAFAEECDVNYINILDGIGKDEEDEEDMGLYTQALSEGLTNCLQPYLQTLVEVQELVTRNETLTLSFIYSYVEKYRGLFNTLNRIIKTIKSRKLEGCQILSAIHQNILSGDEMVHQAVIKIFTALNRVFVTQLTFWLLNGQLVDELDEFFVCQNKKELPKETSKKSNSVASVSNGFDTTELVTALQNTSLDCEYLLNPHMIPYYIPLSLAQDILFVGKTVILFGSEPRMKKKNGVVEIKFSIWEDREKEFYDKLNNLKNEETFEGHSLRIVVKEIKECITKHLWSAAVEEAHLLHELRLMKEFFLLGRGELFLEWLRLSSHHLDGPVTRSVSKDLNQAFEMAARAVFLGNCVDVKKFSFEVPSAKHNTANINVNTATSTGDDSSVATDGWSTIVLKYDIKWPLHLLFTPEVLARYNDLFRLLLRIKKTQHDLHVLWKTYKKSTNVGLCQMHNKLMFLMDNLQHYLQADVLETSFARLADAAAAANGDFEQLRCAHAHYLADILSHAFVTVTPSDGDSSNDSTETINNPVFSNIMELLKLCDFFCEMSGNLKERESQDYYLIGYNDRYNKVVRQLMSVLSSRRARGGRPLARLLMRLDYNRWLSAHLDPAQTT